MAFAITRNSSLGRKSKKATRLGGLFTSSGAAGRSRTGDLRITNALLYQLSYSGDKAENYILNIGIQQDSWRIDGFSNEPIFSRKTFWTA